MMLPLPRHRLLLLTFCLSRTLRRSSCGDAVTRASILDDAVPPPPLQCATAETSRKESSSPSSLFTQNIGRRAATSSTCLQAARSSDDPAGDASSNQPPSFQMVKSPSMDKYHLVWSPGAWKKMVLTTVALFIIPRILPASLSFSSLPASTFLSKVPPLAVATWKNLALPLAASSCCLIQLGLNLLSVGCAGWNTYLGPLRPYFLSILLYSAVVRPPARWTTLLWRTVVALLPELVHAYNQWKNVASTSALSAPQRVVEVALQIPTMGCVACIQTVDHALRKQSNVLYASSQLKPMGAKGGQAVVQLGIFDEDDDNNVENRIQDLIDAIQAAGFDGAQVESMRSRTTT